MILVLGGIKSGKSSFAEKLAQEREPCGPVMYLATAKAGDAEMAERIRVHQAQRPPHWQTCEEPMNPALVFNRTIGVRIIIMDCVTNWLTNVIAHLGEEPQRSEVIRLGRKKVAELIQAIRCWEYGGGNAVLVSNQIEVGLVSAWPLGRYCQDLAGLTHQQLAEVSKEVYVLNAGLPQKLK